MSERLWQISKDWSTRYQVESNSLPELRRYLEPLPTRVPIIADPRVWDIYGPAVEAALSPCEPLVLHLDGEREKQFDAVERLVLELAANRIHRREKLVLFGGGVCCDVGGMVAMLYMRGMHYAIVAASLMAQVDAAIGGKVGCNAAARKNLLGGFHHADLVLLDTSFLKTLPPRHLRAALAEAVKLAVLLPEESRMLSLLEGASDGDDESLSLLVDRCLTGKLALLEADPFENDLRRTLNLGHAVAHTLENLRGCSLLHGEAVAVGLAATARYAEHEGVCGSERAGRIVAQLERLGLPTSASVDLDELRSRLKEIPDHRGGSIHLVIPAGDEGAEIREDCDIDLLVDCVEGLPVA